MYSLNRAVSSVARRAECNVCSLQPLFVAAGFQDMAPKMVWSLSGKSIHLRMLADTRTKLGL